MKPIKVLYIIDNLRIGGTQTIVGDLAGSLPKDRFDISIVNLRGDTEVAAELRSAGLAVDSLGLSKFNLSAGRTLRTLINRAQPSIVHTHLDFSNVFGARAALAEEVPVVVRHDHSGCMSQGRRYFLKRALAEKLVGAGTHTIAISENVRNFNLALGRHPSTVTVIYNCVDVNKFQPIVGTQESDSLDSPTVGFVGRIIRRKGLQYLIEAAPAILRQVPNAKFVIVGDGPYCRELRARVVRVGLTESFNFLGYQAEPARFYGGFDVMVVPSTFEPFGLTNIEAMAMGRPVVGSDVGGIAEIIENEVSGFLVPPRDSRMLAEKITQLLLDPQLAAGIGSQARRHVERRFSVEAASRQMVELYEGLLGSASCRHAGI